MKADWNDAPDYITRHPRKKRRLAKLIPGLIGTLVTLAVLHTAGSAFLKGTAQSIAEKRVQPKPALVAEVSRAEPAPAARDWDKVVEEVATRGAMPQPNSAQPQSDLIKAQPSKQTVFNDNNYDAQGAHNVVPAISTYQPKELPAPKKKQEVVVVGKETRYRDFCPFRDGSIERRNCKMSVDLNHR
ncbi:hypothetical protein M0M42_01035 [Pseudomonas knackmussii]|uniref:Uncharacterized protein n=1 Tax=Pseudomonas knackmussii TaxID=65741 RepID=A0ABY4KQD3_9PSED|nr:hypothetical protein [Pseudomonas knackmussii]UPQ83030.1 hypothetical protein M0M42_01035 [Pseudomonas knackmussii]